MKVMIVWNILSLWCSTWGKEPHRGPTWVCNLCISRERLSWMMRLILAAKYESRYGSTSSFVSNVLCLCHDTDSAVNLDLKPLSCRGFVLFLARKCSSDLGLR